MYTILDNNGETFDRYTIVCHNSGAIYGASANPFHPMGFGQYCGDVPSSAWETIQQAVKRYLKDAGHLGKPVNADDVPADVVKYAEQMCNQPDELTF